MGYCMQIASIAIQQLFIFRRINPIVIKSIFDLADEYDSYEYGSALAFSGEQFLESEKDNLSSGCHYLHHPIGWKLFIILNFVVMFIIPFLVSFYYTIIL